MKLVLALIGVFIKGLGDERALLVASHDGNGGLVPGRWMKLVSALVGLADNDLH